MALKARAPIAALAITLTLGLAACSSPGSTEADAGNPAPIGGNQPPPLNTEPLPGATGLADSDSDSERRRPPAETDPAVTPHSTFAMDVDTASYGYARSLINEGQRPAPEEVRPEEFINSFQQDYPQPGGDGFSVTVDGARLPANHKAGEDHRLLRVGLQTRGEDQRNRPDARLTFVIDVSGSMSGAAKLGTVQRALHGFVDEARPTDAIAIVTFSDRARVVREMTPAADKAALHDAIDGLRTESSTNLEEGLTRGYELARGAFQAGVTNRVVLVSDALANVGNTEASPILAQVREAAGKQITLLGVGVGNDYGDQLMEQLADQGDGFVVYVSEPEQARRVFVEQLPAALSVRALDAKVQVTFDPRAVTSYRLIGYDNRALAAEDFRDDGVDGGEVMAGHSVTALYAVRVKAGAGGQVAHVQLRWQDPRTREAVEASGEATVAALSGPFESAGPRFQVVYAAAWFAEKLRQSGYGSEVDNPTLAALVDQAAARTEDPAVTELAALIRRAGY